MAKLSNETLTMTFQLLRQLAEAIELASATEWTLLELWAKAIENGQSNLEAANASIQEIKRGWNLS
jgi:hypothetical protein